VKESKAGADNHVTTRSDVVGQAQTGIEILPLRVEDLRRPSLPLPTQAAVKGEAAGRTPFVLDVQAIISMVQGAFGLIADSR